MLPTVEVQFPNYQIITCNYTTTECEYCTLVTECVVFEKEGINVCPKCVGHWMSSKGYYILPELPF